MKISMFYDAIVILSEYGTQVYNQKRDRLNDTLCGISIPELIVYDGKPILRASLQMLFYIFGDQLAPNRFFRDVFVQGSLDVKSPLEGQPHTHKPIPNYLKIVPNKENTQ